MGRFKESLKVSFLLGRLETVKWFIDMRKGFVSIPLR